MKKVLIGFLPAMFILAVTASASISNSGFETPEVNNNYGWDIFDSGLGWTAEWYSQGTSYNEHERPVTAYMEFHRGVNGWLPYEGYQYTELDSDWDGPGGGMSGEPASVKISQSVSTMTGAEYELKYYWSPRPGHADNVLQVFVNGGVVSTHSASGAGNANTVWTEGLYSFEASSETTEIAFAENGTADSMGMFLDAVSITMTEEPLLCEETTIDDFDLGTNRWMWDGEEWITSLPNGKGPKRSYTIEQTQGCSCEQILAWLHENYPEEFGEMKGHWKFGCSISVMDYFTSLWE